MRKSILLSFMIACAIILFSCKKKASDTPEPVETGTMQIKFEHVLSVKNQDEPSDLELNTAYTSENDETFKITKLKYYVSNVVLTRIDGTVYNVPESYFLVDASAATASVVAVTLTGIPVAQYRGLSFLLGVDSTRNVSGKQEGDLDVGVAGKGQDMFWDWKTGYVFVKYEGTYSDATVTDEMFMYHLGGFKKSESSLKTVNLPFNASGTLSVLNVNKTGVSQVHLEVDVEELVTNFNTTTNFMGASSSFADKAASMFTFEHVHN